MNTPESSRCPSPGSALLNRHAELARASREEQGRVQNACRRCGATAYKPLMIRDKAGVMSASGQYQCVHCRLVFNRIEEWRTAAAPAPFPAAASSLTRTPVSGPGRIDLRAG
jgi:hypothetical protein